MPFIHGYEAGWWQPGLHVTREEACQRILEGEAWSLCFTCNGLGYKGNRPGHDKPFVVENCPACKGRGEVLCGSYKEACLMLGIPLPELSEAPAYIRLGIDT